MARNHTTGRSQSHHESGTGRAAKKREHRPGAPRIDTSAYQKGDVRRLLAVLYAIHKIGSPTLTEISAGTGISKPSVLDAIRKATDQLHVVIEREGNVYRIASWGGLLRRDGVLQLGKELDAE